MSTESPAEKMNQVSIICRSMGRAELQHALQSIASQDYPNIEIILIDAAGDNALDTTAAGDCSIEVVTTGATLSRSQAANAGLDAAHGKFILFLDDDDWIAANHISQLVDVLESDDKISAAYSSTQKTNSAGKALDYVFKEKYDPVLLMRDNYIPIHAILFERTLLDKGCRFDTSFDIYEDWDFWLQLSEHTDFRHLDTITAYYREGGDSDTAAEDVRERYQAESKLGKARAALFEKWLPKWTGEKVNALIGQLDQSELLHEKDDRIRSELEKNHQLRHEVAKLESKATELHQQMQDMLSHSEVQAQHIAELELILNAIYDSTSWKLMGPVRRIGRALSKSDGSRRSDSDLEK
jgi:glycosyltransferase involved in cell wall biosynthesis